MPPLRDGGRGGAGIKGIISQLNRSRPRRSHDFKWIGRKAETIITKPGNGYLGGGLQRGSCHGHGSHGGHAISQDAPDVTYKRSASPFRMLGKKEWSEARWNQNGSGALCCDFWLLLALGFFFQPLEGDRQTSAMMGDSNGKQCLRKLHLYH